MKHPADVFATIASTSPLIVQFSASSVRRIFSILLTECSTVVWWRPPNSRPISFCDAPVSSLAIYIASWRGRTYARR
jgi:hypothetical protein